jgi:predicted N-formylglutamate amidohydrolase
MKRYVIVSGKGKCSLGRELAVIVSCEHAVNTVPGPFASLFRGYDKILRSHRGYDIGAPLLADLLAARFGVAAHLSTVTRLIVDLNRSVRNPRRFSEISRRLTPRQKEDVMEEYYRPYRRKIESEIGRLCSRGKGVLHLSVHTFTPVLEGKVRFADIGLLYDPSRKREGLFCRGWKLALRGEDPTLKVRLNYPYSGKSDGLTTHLRTLFGGEVYLGIEIEVNQKYALGKKKRWLGVQRAILNSITSAFEGI